MCNCTSENLEIPGLVLTHHPGMTATHTTAFPRQSARVMLESPAPKERAWGMPGAQCTRSLVCEDGVWNAHEYSQRVHRKTPGIPHATVYGLYRALLGDRAFLPPSPLRSLLPGDLNASIGASGPHGFAVRIGAVRQERRRVHRIQPRVRDDRDTPLEWGGRRQFYTDFGLRKIGIFLQMGLDTASRGARTDLPVGSILGLMRPLGIDRIDLHRFP